MKRALGKSALLFVVWMCQPLRASAQVASTQNTPAAADTAVEVSLASPRRAIEQFLTLARAGQYSEAATFLDLPDSVREHAEERARQLKAVLDRNLWIDLERLSPLAVGDTADGLPSGIDQIGTVRGADGVPVPIRVARNQSDADAAWRFTRTTTSRITLLYAALPGRWALEQLPEPLLRPGPFELLWWQWLAVPVLLALATAVGALSSRILRSVFVRAVKRTRSAWDDALVSRLSAPLTAAFSLLAALLLLQWLALYPPAELASRNVLRAGLFLVFFWSLARLVDVVCAVLSHSRWASSPSSRALLPLGARVAKVCVFGIALVAVLSLLNYPVASLIAGLGLGGLALALAAQKTVENLFGAFSLGVDQPIREGDFVKVDEFVGTVESIGLRSTRFRTLDRTLITIPNGRLADMRLESFTARDRLRLATIIGLEYQTSEMQMRAVLTGFERVLRQHPRIWPDAVVVRFREFAASSLDIEIMAWFQTADWNEFQLIRQEILLQFMAVVEQEGTSFAYPTQTVHIASTPAAQEWRVSRALHDVTSGDNRL